MTVVRNELVGLESCPRIEYYAARRALINGSDDTRRHDGCSDQRLNIRSGRVSEAFGEKGRSRAEIDRVRRNSNREKQHGRVNRIH
jgi:hypothetical protein